MDRQSAPPGPEIGWAFGGVGFVATAFVGWLMGSGLGFVLFAVLFWGALGALFAFLVERSTIEEHDRADELQNTRLATLQPAAVPTAVRGAPRSREGADPAPRGRGHGEGSAVRPTAASSGNADAPARAAVAASSEPAGSDRRPHGPRRPATATAPLPRSPREGREARADAGAARQDHAAA